MMADHNVRFWGEIIPREIVSMAKHLKNVDKKVFRQVLKVVVNALEEKECSVSIADIQDSSLSEEQLGDIVSGMNALLSEALRVPPSSMKLKSFEEDLRELRIFEEFIADLSSIAFGYGRPTLNASVTKHDPRLPKLENLRWRVDVAVSTSSLSRALQPTILMQLTLSDGNHHQCEITRCANTERNAT